MKVDIIRKFKWYIVGFILVVIMLSVGLSFCTWDDLSINKALSQAKTGGFNAIKLNEYLTLVDDKNKNLQADVGDVVNFGSYYQEAPQINGEQTVLPDKTSLRWIVVEKQGTTLTLLTENVVAFGSFWGTYCYNEGNESAWGSTEAKYQTYYQNYEQSTVRAWLNSNYTLRNDGGTAFAQSESGVFKGFLNEAFNEEERAYIQDKTISGMYGSKKAAGDNTVNSTYCENYNTSVDKVWLPSYSEVYGNTAIDWNDKNDGLPNKQFSYFDNTSNSKVGKTTAFASSRASNYTYRGKTVGTLNWQNSSTGGSVWWWLRSPNPWGYPYSLMVHTDGSGDGAYTNRSDGGVRPVVCVQL